MAVSSRFFPAFIAAIAACFTAPAAAQTEIEISPSSREALGVETAKVAPAAASTGVRAPAMIIAPAGGLRGVNTPYSGVLVDALTAPGVEVKAGDPLAVIYSGDYSEGAAELQSRRLTMAHMSELSKRADELLKLGLRSQQEADEAHHDAMTARINYDALNTQLEYIKRGERPGQFILTAPAGGIVTHVAPKAGAMIDAGAVVISILTSKTLWAEAQLSERQAANLTRGLAVSIEGISASGEIVSVDPEIDPETRSLSVMVALPPVREWRLGAMLTLSFPTAVAGKGVVLVPSNALVRIGGVEVVFVQTENGFRTETVDIVSRTRQDALIRGDVKPGEEVAVSGLAALKNIASGV
ncbi:MAG: efflux RND transporter periplasmic adaptor subunit [Parvularculaceae bacterium]